MILELTNIYHHFPETEWELNITQFTVAPGEILGIVGPNGSGKSTLLRIGAGILSPLQGEIRLDKQDIKELKRPAIAQKLGYLPQELSSEYDISVEDLVRMGRYPHTRGFGLLGPVDWEVIDISLKLTEMSPLRRKEPFWHRSSPKDRRFFFWMNRQVPSISIIRFSFFNC
jgi:iron complex transport system ATP-binding protein